MDKAKIKVTNTLTGQSETISSDKAYDRIEAYSAHFSNGVSIMIEKLGQLEEQGFTMLNVKLYRVLPA